MPPNDCKAAERQIRARLGPAARTSRRPPRRPADEARSLLRLRGRALRQPLVELDVLTQHARRCAFELSVSSEFLFNARPHEIFNRDTTFVRHGFDSGRYFVREPDCDCLHDMTLAHPVSVRPTPRLPRRWAAYALQLGLTGRQFIRLIVRPVGVSAPCCGACAQIGLFDEQSAVFLNRNSVHEYGTGTRRRDPAARRLKRGCCIRTRRRNGAASAGEDAARVPTFRSPRSSSVG